MIPTIHPAAALGSRRMLASVHCADEGLLYPILITESYPILRHILIGESLRKQFLCCLCRLLKLPVIDNSIPWIALFDIPC